MRQGDDALQYPGLSVLRSFWVPRSSDALLRRRAERGATGMQELMQLTPCDIFPYLRGRTIWLVGDSMMQVRTTVSSLSWLCRAMCQADSNT